MRRLETELADRILRFDGVSIARPDVLAGLLLRGVKPNQVRVANLTDDILIFNQQVIEEEQIKVAVVEPINIDLGWRLPQEYLQLDLEDYVAKRFEQVISNYSEAVQIEALDRIVEELSEIKNRGMDEFTKTIIYILDVFRAKNVVWGVGRGSSCASYILFLIGLHVVDCVLFKVPLTEFFHD